jgi:tRNA/tmRNA/rRNA uracil-C5-methylase (TrmA/RlmC/RlmD family)
MIFRYSLFAVDAGASQVHACECSSTMVHIAQQVIEANQVTDKINLIPKMSTDLLVPQDLPNRYINIFPNWNKKNHTIATYN